MIWFIDYYYLIIIDYRKIDIYLFLVFRLWKNFIV